LRKTRRWPGHCDSRRAFRTSASLTGFDTGFVGSKRCQ
jgi:hypothetical protein